MDSTNIAFLAVVFLAFLLFGRMDKAKQNPNYFILGVILTMTSVIYTVCLKDYWAFNIPSLLNKNIELTLQIKLLPILVIANNLILALAMICFCIVAKGGPLELADKDLDPSLTNGILIGYFCWFLGTGFVTLALFAFGGIVSHFSHQELWIEVFIGISIIWAIAGIVGIPLGVWREFHIKEIPTTIYPSEEGW